MKYFLESKILYMYYMCMKKLVFVLPVLLLLSGCNRNLDCVWTDCAEPVCPLDSDCLSEIPEWNTSVDTDITELWQKVLIALKNDDMTAFSEFVDPDKWVKFSAYWNVRDDDIILMRPELLWARDEPFTWGMYDGSGEPIEMTTKEYFEKFVYNHDYLQAPEVIKWDMITRWNTIININEYYPNGNCIEYYFPAFNPEYGWMDWESLVLIFDKDTNYLIWIAHEQWSV